MANAGIVCPLTLTELTRIARNFTPRFSGCHPSFRIVPAASVPPHTLRAALIRDARWGVLYEAALVAGHTRRLIPSHGEHVEQVESSDEYAGTLRPARRPARARLRR